MACSPRGDVRRSSAVWMMVLLGSLSGSLLGWGSDATASTAGPDPERHARRPPPQSAPQQQQDSLAPVSLGSARPGFARSGGGGGGGSLNGFLQANKTRIEARARDQADDQERLTAEGLELSRQMVGRLDQDEQSLFTEAGHEGDTAERDRCRALLSAMQMEMPGGDSQAFLARCQMFPMETFTCEQERNAGDEHADTPHCRELLANLDRERTRMARAARPMTQRQSPLGPTHPVQDDGIGHQPLQPESLTQQ